MNRLYASLFLFATFIVAPPAVSAAPATVPSDLNPGDTYRLVFVTSTERDAMSSNIADYNAFVTAAANSVPELLALGTTWKAIGSTETVDARDNTGTNPGVATGVPIYTLADTRIANDNADLWDGMINVPLNLTELETLVVVPGVWTGSMSDGTADAFNDLWLGGASAQTGDMDNIVDFGRWIRNQGNSTFNEQRFYGLSGELTVVPEPSGIALAALGLTGLVCWRRVRRYR
jgi:hypothetical protein